MSQPVGIVTGGASGIGLAVTTHLLSPGYKVVIADLNDAEGTRLAFSLGDNVIFQHTDVSSFEQQRALFDRAFKWAGNRLDFLAANAGVDDRQSLYQVNGKVDEHGLPLPLTLKTVEVCLDATLQGIWLFKFYARRNKNPGGNIVITDSAAGLGFISWIMLILASPMTTNPQYATAKHGLVGLTRSAGPVFLKENITINCICPALVLKSLALPNIRDIFPKEHITPMSTVIKAFDAFLDNDQMAGQTVELSLHELHFRKQVDYPNECQRWIGTKSGALWEQDYKEPPSRHNA